MYISSGCVHTYVHIYLYTCMTLGVEICVAGESRSKTIKTKLLYVVMDLPAKASMLNCNQYNGIYGCSTCKHPGQTVSS